MEKKKTKKKKKNCKKKRHERAFHLQKKRKKSSNFASPDNFQSFHYLLTNEENYNIATGISKLSF